MTPSQYQQQQQQQQQDTASSAFVWSIFRASRILLALGACVLLKIQWDTLHEFSDSFSSSSSGDDKQFEQQQQQDDLITTTKNLDQERNGNINLPPTESFAACLFVRDNNREITEWLAYHYHVMPLRRLIIFEDPTAQTSVQEFLQPWKSYINITYWNSDEHIFPIHHHSAASSMLSHFTHAHHFHDHHLTNEHHKKIQERNYRQQIFLGKCLQQLKDEGRGWVMTTQTDEYTLVNPRLRNEKDPYLSWNHALLHASRKTGKTIPPFPIPSQRESGSVLKVLKRSRPYAEYSDYIFDEPCIGLNQKVFSTREVNTTWPSSSNTTTLLGFNTTYNFQTLRWRFWGRQPTKLGGSSSSLRRQQQAHPDGEVRKTLLDLSRVSHSHLNWRAHPHKPLMEHTTKLCPLHEMNLLEQQIREHNSLFVLHHYTGTMESVRYGLKRVHPLNTDKVLEEDIKTDRHNQTMVIEERLHRDVVHNRFYEEGDDTIRNWLPGFVENVGLAQAKRLLESVGKIKVGRLPPPS